MLEPRDRILLFDALRPPEGFRFDQGIGTTYSLDLLALLTAPLAFTWFEQQSDEDLRPSVDSLEILESLRRHADRLSIFCHAGRIALPKTFYPQLAFVEGAIIECQPPEGGAFHSKVWVLRWLNDAGDVHYRVLCLSRNLTFARAWDTLLALDGVLSTGRRSAIPRNRGLADFVRALPSFARRRVDKAVAQRIETLASELDRTEFTLPDGLTDYRFWPLGIGGRSREPLAEAGDRLLIVSPFVTLGTLEGLADRRQDVTVVSTPSQLARLARKPKGIKLFYSLIDRAVPESDAEQEEKPESLTEAIQQSDLHAKLYVSESGWDAHIWTGSANATDAAFNRNVECLVELIGPRKRFGIDALMEPQKGEIRFIDLLEDATRVVASESVDSTIEELEKRIEGLRCVLSGSSLVAKFSSQGDTFDVEVVYTAGPRRFLGSDVAVRCWPVTVTSSIGVAFDKLEPSQAIARFSALSFQAITSFFAFELIGRAGGEQQNLCFVLNLPLTGAPEGRREQVLRSLLRDRSRVLRFLWLLLADEGIPPPEAPPLENWKGEGAEQSTRFVASGLFEVLLRNLDRAPERLDHLNSLLQELRKGAKGEDLMPDGFEAIWEPVWRQRERLRSRSRHVPA
jgi:hypothetical protein